MMAEAKKKETKKEDGFAVIETGGKQYLVRLGDKIKIEKIEKPERGTVVNFDKVLLLAKGKTVKIGTPYLKTIKVKGEWAREFKGKKVTNVRYKSKTRQSRKKGHRQVYTEVIIADF